MRFRPLDENGDMMPVQHASQMLTEARAVAAVVQSRLVFFRGDWWEDKTLGFQVPKFLMDGLRGNRTTDTLLNYIVAYIVKSEGVSSLASATHTMHNRDFVAYISVNTIYGQNVEGSVSVNELLGAVSG